MRKICIILVLLICFLMWGCTVKEYNACMNQDFEDVFRIELYSVSDEDETLLYTLKESETFDFWTKLSAIPFGRYVNDPPTCYGILAIKITYRDGAVDIIGTDINSYCDPSGQMQQTGWYYVADRSTFIELFSQYVDRSLLPKASH